MDSVDPAGARVAIENLMFTYAERIDGGDFAGVAALFAKARMLGPEGELQGEGAEQIEAIYDRSTKLYEDGTPMTQHVTTNLQFAFAENGRTASVRSRFTVMQGLADFPLQCIITGYYEDRFAYDEEDGWHFTERRMKPKLLGDLSRHLKYDLGTA
ncbi:MAG: Ring hydroxylating enzyme beta subunit [Deltaproteobacteria bacterium]|jgi:hypothetical protein|nr:Ring hydroxylating enzyme beta subunit [Deltaproteobacteria bacterium]